MEEDVKKETKDDDLASAIRDYMKCNVNRIKPSLWNSVKDVFMSLVSLCICLAVGYLCYTIFIHMSNSEIDLLAMIMVALELFAIIITGCISIGLFCLFLMRVTCLID